MQHELPHKLTGEKKSSLTLCRNTNLKGREVIKKTGKIRSFSDLFGSLKSIQMKQSKKGRSVSGWSALLRYATCEEESWLKGHKSKNTGNR